MDKKLYYNTLLTAALIIGVVLSLPNYALWLLGIAPAQIPLWGVLNIIYLFGVPIYIFIRFGNKARGIVDPDQSKGWSYGKALGFVMLTALATSVIMAIFSWIYINHLDTEVLQKTIKTAEEMALMLDPDISDKDLDMTKSVAISFWGILFNSVMVMTLLGVITGLISAAIIKREPKFTDEIEN